MQSSQRKSLERLLNKIAKAPIEELSTCSLQLLQQIEDKVHEARDQSPKINQAQHCVPSERRNQTTPNPEDGGTMPDNLVQSLLGQIDKVGEFLRQDAEDILRKGMRQRSEDPRIDDIARLEKTTASERLRFLLGCLTLSEDRQQFLESAQKKNRSDRSERSFATLLGIKNTRKDESSFRRIRRGISLGKKIKALNPACRLFLIFVNWTSLTADRIETFGRSCLEDQIIQDLLPVTAEFLIDCVQVYRRLLHERRGTKSNLSTTNAYVERRGKRLIPRLRAGDASVTNTGSVSAGEETSDPQVPPFHSQPTHDTDTSGVETDWPRGRGRDQFQVLNDLPLDINLIDYATLPLDINLIDYATLPLDNNLIDYATLPLDNNLIDYATLPLASKLTEFVPTDDNETQLPTTENRATQFPMTDNVDYNSVQPQSATSENDPTQSQVGTCDRLGYPSVQCNELAANTPANYAISVF